MKGDKRLTLFIIVLFFRDLIRNIIGLIASFQQTDFIINSKGTRRYKWSRRNGVI